MPQLDRLTVREHLELFGRIKGIPESQLDEMVLRLMEGMNLGKFENKLAGALSGGNKRKLSVGVAMIGSPPLVFMDGACAPHSRAKRGPEHISSGTGGTNQY